MQLLPGTRHSARAFLNPSLLRLSSVSSTQTCFPRHSTRVPVQSSIESFHRTFALSGRSFRQPFRTDRGPGENTKPSINEKLHAVRAEKIWTIPNVLTISRMLSCPVLGYAILIDNFRVATGLLVYAGLTDLVRMQITLHHAWN